MGKWKVWIKEGTWRVLAYYDSASEAIRGATEAQKDGVLAVFCRDGGTTDRLMYRGGPPEGSEGANAQA